MHAMYPRDAEDFPPLGSTVHPFDTDRRGWHPRSRFIEVNEHVIHYVELGDPDAPPLLMLHGYLMSSWGWRFNLDALATKWRVIAPCHLGFGYSDRPRQMKGLTMLRDAIVGFLDALGIERCAILGLSMGGAVALHIALQHPERVERLVLEDSAGLAWNVPRILRLIPLFVVTLPMSLLPMRKIFQRILRRIAYFRMPVDEDFMDGFMRPLGIPGSRKSVISIARSFSKDLEDLCERLGEVSQPTLVMWGREDRILPLHMGETLAETLPNARFVVFDESGHCPNEEYPERFNRLVMEFLEASDPGTDHAAT